MVNINDCQINWHRGAGRMKSLIRVTHLPTGYQVERPCELSEDWRLDDALAEIEQMMQASRK